MRCLFCRSIDIGGDELRVDEGRVWQEITCNDCGRVWVDQYVMEDVLPGPASGFPT